MSRIADALFGARGRYVAFGLFLAIVGMTGGGSRADIQSLIILRPVAVLFIGYALLLCNAHDLRRVRGPLVILLAFIILALLQLVPLPWSVWTSLPGRAPVMQADILVGMQGVARPLSLDPDRTWNTVFALLVPLAAVLLVAIQRTKLTMRTIGAIAVVGLVSAVVGYLQAVGVQGLYFYRITHDNHPVGLFANKNHQSILLLWLLVTAAWFVTRIDPRGNAARLQLAAGVAVILVLFPLLLLTGSRAGLVLAVPGLLVAGWLMLRAAVVKAALRATGKKTRLALYGVAAVLFLVLIGVFADLALSGRQTALDRLFAADPAEEQRWIYFPVLIQMAQDFFVSGSGFGSFEELFNQYEPGAVLSTRYLNQAHLDPLQIVIEGGFAGLLLMLGGMAWLAGALWRTWREPMRPSQDLAIYVAGTLALFMAASLVDYPVRTPLVATVFAILTATLAARSNALVPDRDVRG